MPRMQATPSKHLVSNQRVTATYQEEGEDNASEEEPTADTERNVDTSVAIVRGTRVEDGVGPRRGGKHGDCGEDIGDIDEE